MKKKREKSKVRGIRAKESVWDSLQKIADKDENGNLNHLVNKALQSCILKYRKKAR